MKLGEMLNIMTPTIQYNQISDNTNGILYSNQTSLNSLIKIK